MRIAAVQSVQGNDRSDRGQILVKICAKLWGAQGAKLHLLAGDVQILAVHIRVDRTPTMCHVEKRLQLRQILLLLPDIDEEGLQAPIGTHMAKLHRLARHLQIFAVPPCVEQLPMICHVDTDRLRHRLILLPTPLGT